MTRNTDIKSTAAAVDRISASRKSSCRLAGGKGFHPIMSEGYTRVVDVVISTDREESRETSKENLQSAKPIDFSILNEGTGELNASKCTFVAPVWIACVCDTELK